MWHSPWEANNQSASQEIPHLSCNLKVHYHIHKSPPLVLILGQTHPVHTFPLYFLTIHSNIIFPSCLGLPSGLFPSGLPTKILYEFLILPVHATCPTHQLMLYRMQFCVKAQSKNNGPCNTLQLEVCPSLHTTLCYSYEHNEYTT